MARPASQTESRSLRLYARLLRLYPAEILQRHRAEMLQNFADLEQATASKTALWLLIGKDLTMSLASEFFASRLGRYVVAVLVTWLLIFTVGYFRNGSTPGYPALHAFGGFLIGMLGIYIATGLYGTGQDRTPAYVIGVLVLSIMVFTIGYLRYVSTPYHPLLQVFGGVLIGMLAMYIATCVYGSPQMHA